MSHFKIRGKIMKASYKYSEIIKELKYDLEKYGEDFKIKVLKKKRKIKFPFQNYEIYLEVLEDYVLDKEYVLEEEKKEYVSEEMSIAEALAEFIAQDAIL